MNFPSPIIKMNEQWENKLPFVLFSMPDTTSCTLYFQNDTTLHTTESYFERGFVFAPFNYTGKSLFIPFKDEHQLESEITPQTIDEVQLHSNTQTGEKQQHLDLVNVILQKVNVREVIKVVASRKKNIATCEVDLKQLAMRLLQLYPTAFRYVWYHPDTGLWCGASPESLVACDGTMFSTMALAGTKKVVFNQPPSWTYKEINEQQLVTDAIVTNLQQVTAVIKTSKPITVHAGSLYHLKTEIKGVIKSGKSTLPKIIKAIHPTPAVCGTPRNKAKRIILEHEKYDREFYTGFLGPIDGLEKKASLFVNLRCAKIDNNVASFYVGGGIIAGSDAEDEWEETENKLATMEKVLAPFLKY